ncbi:MAG TPA: lytic transglycosylase domain-containing protein [Gaiellaceae bacterium]
MKYLFGLAITAAALLCGLTYVHLSQPDWWARLWHPLRYEQIVLGHAAHYDLDPALLAAVIYQESRFDANARSSSGAIGLMQLMPETAQGIADHTGGSRFKLSDLDDPEINIRYGAWYLSHLMKKYGSEKLALAAYNAGQQNVDNWLADGSGIAFPETRAYIARVESLKKLYRRIYPVLRSDSKQR